MIRNDRRHESRSDAGCRGGQARGGAGRGLSTAFKKQLGLTDLVLTQIVFVVGTIWVGTAARLGVGKWVHNAGGVLLLLTFPTLVGLPILSLLRGKHLAYHPFAFAIPAFSASNPEFITKSLNIFSKLALGALTGFEYVAILAGECKAPTRNIGRSVIIAAPIIALMFILGTASVLAFGLLGIAGVGMQEANQLLDNAAGIFYASTYVVLFAIPLFAAKLIGVALIFNLAGVALFLAGLRRKRATATIR